uniref:Trans-cinnamate 4-monooxygenase n=1 Tax=Salix viminalis TaxID=40686 RepID=A0A6N2KIG9_SALVM
MAHSATKSMFFTLLAVAFVSCMKFACPNYLSTARFSQLPLSIILPLLPLILYFLTSIVARSSASKNLPPGPVSYPLFGNWLQVGNDLNHRLLASLSQTYGAVFLLKLGSKNLAVVSDPELANQVLHAQGVEFGSRPRNVVFDIFTGGGQDMVFTVYGEHWRKMRRIMTLPFFTNKVVNQYSNSWEQEMDLVVEDIKDNEKVRTEGIVIRKRLQLMLYNIMYRMMFDARFQSQEDPLFVQATRFNSERSRLAQSFEYNYGDFIPWLRPFLRGYLNKCRDLQQRRLAFFNNYFIEERRKIMASNGEKHKISCAMDHIIHAQMKGEISEENVLYIVENINVAAIETTLWSMEWAIAELVNHPTVQERIRDEITAVLKGNPVTESSLHELPYLQATIKETLRLHTPIPLLVPHMNLEEAKLGGFTIPKESKVVVNAWWLANNPEWWEKPSEFRPERFLEEDRDTDAVVGGKVDFRFLPFGMGRRSCPGIILAMPILGLVVARLVSNFEMKAPSVTGKIDVGEKGGQFSLHIANHSTVVFDPIKA